MTDAGVQLAILSSLSAIGIGAGCALAAVNFADSCLGGRPLLRFFAEFCAVAGAGALVWLVVLGLADGNFRLFFALPTTFFCTISYICIAKALSPLTGKARAALSRTADSRKGGFIVRFILK